MADCPPNAINRGPDGEVYINDTCIGCGNCQRNCPYGVIRMAKPPPKKPSLLRLAVLRQGSGPRRARPRMDRRQGQFGDSKKSDQMRHVFWYRGWAGMRSRMSDRCRDPGFSGRVPQRDEDGTGGLIEGGKQGGSTGRIWGTGRLMRASCAIAAIAGSRSPRSSRCSSSSSTSSSTSQPRHNGGSWLGYTLGTIGAGLIVWLVAARHPQAGDDPRPLVAEGLDLGPCLSRPRAGRHRHAPHRLPVRLERPHARLCADDAGHPVRHLRHLGLRACCRRASPTAARR